MIGIEESTPRSNLHLGKERGLASAALASGIDSKGTLQVQPT